MSDEWYPDWDCEVDGHEWDADQDGTYCMECGEEGDQ